MLNSRCCQVCEEPTALHPNHDLEEVRGMVPGKVRGMVRGVRGMVPGKVLGKKGVGVLPVLVSVLEEGGYGGLANPESLSVAILSL
jgi:hypothetical protein